MSRKPKIGSAAWEAELWKSPAFLRATLKSIVKRGSKGDAEALKSLELFLADRPEMRSQVRQFDDLADRVERLWAKRLAGVDGVAETANREHAAALKRELLAGSDSPVDKILAGALVVAHLAHQHAAQMAAHKAQSPEVEERRQRRLTAAQKRLFAAAKQWRLITDKKAKPARPGLKIFDPEAA